MFEMQKIKAFVLDAVNGKGQIEESFKYGMVIEITRIVHIVLFLIFGFMHILPACLYHLCSIFWYSIAKQMVTKGKYMRSFYMSYIEIMLNTYIMTYLFGRECGFYLYNMLIVPLAFYLSYTHEGVWNRFLKPFLMGGLSFLEFVIMYMGADNFSGLFALTGGRLNFFYILNTFIVFASMVLFVTCFVAEINGRQHKLQQQNEELEKLANYDPLTGLQNRRSMRQKIKLCRFEHKEFALILADIDDFKMVNDTYGHDCGDMILRNVARIIMDTCTDGCFGSRWGGEEFLILVPGQLEDGVHIAEEIRCKIADSCFQYEGVDIPCTMTLGVATYHQKETIEKATSRADARLYYGKNHGKNCVVSQDEE